MPQRHRCPQCKAEIDISSGQCPSCGLLLGKKLLEKMQEEATPGMPASGGGEALPAPAPANPAPPMPQSPGGHQSSAGYITGPQPRQTEPAPGFAGAGYHQSYGVPAPMPGGGMRQPATGPPPGAGPIPAGVSPVSGTTALPGEFTGGVSAGWGTPMSDVIRRFLLKPRTILVLPLLVGLVMYSLASLLGGTTSSADTTADTTPPAIQGVSVSSVTEASAVISWETDDPATSQVMLCDPDGFCTWTEPQEPLVKDHSVPLDNLEPGTLYHYTVISTDEDGNEATAEDEFTTSGEADTTPPQISEVEVASTTESSATVEWSTDEKATGQVEYGTTEDYGSSTSLDEELATGHSMMLTDLEADTTYHFVAKSKDAAGNEAISEADNTFKTAAPVPVGIAVGDRAPDFTLQNLDGDEVTLSEYQGKIVMVNFWATWCDPCVNEMPHFQALLENWSGEEELVILAINREEDADTVESFMDDQGFTFPVLLGPGQVASDYDIDSIPRTFFIDAEGIIQKVQFGGFSNREQIEDILESIQ